MRRDDGYKVVILYRINQLFLFYAAKSSLILMCFHVKKTLFSVLLEVFGIADLEIECAISKG